MANLFLLLTDLYNRSILIEKYTISKPNIAPLHGSNLARWKSMHLCWLKQHFLIELTRIIWYHYISTRQNLDIYQYTIDILCWEPQTDDNSSEMLRITTTWGYSRCAPTEHRAIIFINVQIKDPYTRSSLVYLITACFVKSYPVMSILCCVHVCIISLTTTTKAGLVYFDVLKPDHALHGKPLIVCLHWNLYETTWIH
jgi:hypothetical protein